MFDGLSFSLNRNETNETAAETSSAAAQRPQVEDVIILGSGPAGWSAAIYTARANMNPLLITGNELGGQVATTTDVENYPGFPEGILGPELNQRFQEQAEKFGAMVEVDFVTDVDVNGPPFQVTTASGKVYQAKSLIVATGASPRKLGVPGETRLTGRGTSYCGTCDGFFFRGKEIAVIGGGDSALEEAMFLTRFANKVTVIHRRNQFRAKPIAQERAKANPKINFIMNSVVTAINGENKVQSVTLKNVVTDEVREFPVDGVFVYIGHLPNNALFAGKLAMDEHGYLITDRRMRTSAPGIFAAGEIQDSLFRQVATSVGQGVAAALEAQKYVEELDQSGELQTGSLVDKALP